ncbi:MAG TPA: hypothetical protein DCE41_30710 [Cytophagales bacterium]|nr:hypothetical protein [Cytophagales bacterium]
MRTLRKQRLHALINVGGLALGLAACVLILLYVQYERGYDSFHEKSDRLYLVSEWRFVGADHHTDSTWWGGLAPDHKTMVTLPLPLSQAMKETIPGVEATVAINDGEVLFSWDTRKQREEVYYVQEDFLKMFSFSVTAGSSDALSDPYQIAITERKAREFFGAQTALGQTLQVASGGQTLDFTVGAVVENPPGQSRFDFDFLMHMQHVPGYGYKSTAWEAKNSETYVLLVPGVSSATVDKALQDLHTQHFSEEEEYMRELSGLDATQDAQGLQLVPLPEVHVNNFTPHYTSVHPRYLLLLTILAIAILLIASINYVSLSLARSAGRNLEVGVRKSMGATRASILGQFYTETTLITGVALLLSALLVTWLVPGFGRLMDQPLSLADIWQPQTLRLILGLLLVTVLLAGSYPALYFSRYRTVEVLKGRSIYNVRSGFLRSLVWVQLTLTAALVVGTWGTYQQISFLLNKDLGMDTEHVVRVTNHFGQPLAVGEQRLRLMKEALASSTAVSGVSGIDNSFGQGWSKYGFLKGENTHDRVDVIAMRMEKDGPELLGIQQVEGYSLDSITNLSNKWLVNQAFVEEFGIANVVGSTQYMGNNPARPAYEVVGVVEDFHVLNLTVALEPMLIHFNPDWEGVYSLLIRLKGNSIAEGLAEVEAAWKTVAGDLPFEFSFVEEDVQDQYASFQRQRKLVSYAAGLAIAVAFLGLFGLSGIQVLNRRQELGVRKVLGASLWNLFVLVNRQTLIITLLALATGVPIAGYMLSQWMEVFAYQVTLGITFYAAMVGAILLLVLGTVSYYGWQAGRINPAESLRDE